MKRERSKQPDARPHRHGAKVGRDHRVDEKSKSEPLPIKSIPASVPPVSQTLLKEDSKSEHWDLSVTHGNRYVALSQVSCCRKVSQQHRILVFSIFHYFFFFFDRLLFCRFGTVLKLLQNWLLVLSEKS